MIPREPTIKAGLLAGVWAVGVVLAILALAIISKMIDPSGAPWEHHLLLAIHRSSGPALTDAAGLLTFFGKVLGIVLVCVACVIGWLWRRSAWKVAVLGMQLIALVLIDYGMKPVFGRVRPELWTHTHVDGGSFPSGHALFAIGFYGVIAYLLLLGAGRRTRLVGWLIWALFALALGLTRLVLGVHWPTDLIGGYVAGAILLLASITLVHRSGIRAAQPGLSNGLPRA